jgi:hypothetical protein
MVISTMSGMHDVADRLGTGITQTKTPAKHYLIELPEENKIIIIVYLYALGSSTFPLEKKPKLNVKLRILDLGVFSGLSESSLHYRCR